MQGEKPEPSGTNALLLYRLDRLEADAKNSRDKEEQEIKELRKELYDFMEEVKAKDEKRLMYILGLLFSLVGTTASIIWKWVSLK